MSGMGWFVVIAPFALKLSLIDYTLLVGWFTCLTGGCVRPLRLQVWNMNRVRRDIGVKLRR